MKGKHFKKIHWNKKRIISAILSVTLLLGCISFTTVAWLTYEKKPVVNKFTGSTLEISLTPENTGSPFKLVPGVNYDFSTNYKEYQPTVTIEAGSVECYLFVVVDETDMVKETLNSNSEKTYFVSNKDTDKWDLNTIGHNGYQISSDSSKTNDLLSDNACTVRTVLTPVNAELGLGVVDATEQAKTFDILTSISIHSDGITKEMVHPDYFEDGTQPMPQIKITAYSIQTLGIKDEAKTEEENVKAAWKVVENAIKNGNTNDIVLTQ